ncbi:hypothetical protein LPW11_12915 [Geomonas sp. RF6]|uniref:hypothetical protein n=1 Tax=Geomonas sp. RF6 TaxID=2897342 RepID=UPI001E4B1626|nr:hypothetical protein [Geomonas sp. RF6]UFS68799.1 hypothetical protein LPW11_12915 [Geomonas sp. RF6]
MKRVLTGVVAMLVALLIGGATHAAGPPIHVGHDLTGYNQGGTSLTADYSLRVENQGDLPLSEVTLSLVPLPPLFAERATVNLGYLAPHEKRDVFLQVVIPVRIDAARVSATPLFWAASYRDADGKVAEFAVTSKPGGAK